MRDASASVSTVGDIAIFRKVRLGILPFLFLLYIISHLDRINIGFAALTMNRDLGITSEQFGFLTGIFFVGYFIVEIRSNLILHRVGARLWIARILISWGLVGMILISRSSDRSLERRWHTAVPLLAGGVASLVLLSVTAVGVYGCLGPFWSLPAEFLAGYGAAAGIALINSAGNLGGFVGPYVLGVAVRRTGSMTGGLIFSGLCMVVSAVLMIHFLKSIRGAGPNSTMIAALKSG